MHCTVLFSTELYSLLFIIDTKAKPHFDYYCVHMNIEKVQEREKLREAEASKATKRKRSGVAADDNSSTTASEPPTPAPGDSASSAAPALSDAPEAKRPRDDPSASAASAAAEQPESSTTATAAATSVATAGSASVSSAVAAGVSVRDSSTGSGPGFGATESTSEQRAAKRAELKGLFVELFVKTCVSGPQFPFRERHLKSQADAKGTLLTFALSLIEERTGLLCCRRMMNSRQRELRVRRRTFSCALHCIALPLTPIRFWTLECVGRTRELFASACGRNS